jgi:hypothetical protein
VRAKEREKKREKERKRDKGDTHTHKNLDAELAHADHRAEFHAPDFLSFIVIV